MAIDIAKPQPIRLGDRYLYTLGSYDPVQVTITVERVTDSDVDFALESVAEELHTAIDAIDDTDDTGTDTGQAQAQAGMSA